MGGFLSSLGLRGSCVSKESEEELCGVYESSEEEEWFVESAAAAPAFSFMSDFGAAPLMNHSESLCGGLMAAPMASRRSRCSASRSPPRKGRANAARVSRGSEVDVWGGLTVKQPTRHSEEHITVTVVIYNTVAGGVPSEEDVVAAVDDMEQLYRQCQWDGHLADEGAAFMKDELTVATAQDIQAKLVHQPYKPPSVAVDAADVIPCDEEKLHTV